MAAALHAADAEAPRHITTVVRPDVRTGKLVRAAIVSPRVVTEKVIAPVAVTNAPAAPAVEEKHARPPAGPASNIDEAVERIAAQHALPPALLHSVIKVESNYNPYAISSAGAQGMMQLIPSTARRFGVSNVFNPVENIQGGARYLRYLLDLYKGNYPLALAAYNSGEGNVARYGNHVPPFAETQNYVVLVRKHLEEQKRKADEAARKVKEAQPKSAEPKGEPGVNHITEVVSGDGSVKYVTR